MAFSVKYLIDAMKQSFVSILDAINIKPILFFTLTIYYRVIVNLKFGDIFLFPGFEIPLSSEYQGFMSVHISGLSREFEHPMWSSG